ncbi:MAG: hypothetical protein M3N43_06885 [Actinomycetota bacterium]|nr:hypothetical protein [Actinomycetota bacterium]
MTNANKRKGDWAELAVQKTLQRLGFPWTEKTRAGYARDHGDLHLCPGPAAIAQVKNVRTPHWSEWLEQLAEQKTNAGADVAFLVWKRAGLGETRAGEWLAVMTLAEMTDLLRRAGYGETWTETEGAA